MARRGGDRAVRRGWSAFARLGCRIRRTCRGWVVFARLDAEFVADGAPSPGFAAAPAPAAAAAGGSLSPRSAVVSAADRSLPPGFGARYGVKVT
ncbi:hypothetical protein PSCLAVI8L_270001 [Pseudoclavibacter sp. 8L]|nr:hypothetical protein PSCLAVI8L_270001 [Pseudoclavibacter sp. 8L]